MDSKDFFILALLGLGLFFWRKIRALEGQVGALPPGSQFRGRTAENDEVWFWTDWQGNQREVRIKRHVKFLD